MIRTLSTSGLLALLVLATSGPVADQPASLFWGANGHRVVGEIAQRHLSNAARQGVASLIGDTSLARISTWPDEVRSDPRWDFAAPWHYVTIDDPASYTALPPVPAEQRDLRNIVDAILYFREVLGDAGRSTEERAVALKFLVHFVGDVHQPLHVGRGDDRGGNSVQLFFFGESTNLHSVWDSKLIDQADLSFTELADFIDHASDEQVTAWQDDSVLDWIQESATLREAELYPMEDFPEHVDHDGRLNLSYRYVYLKMPVVEQRLLQGGIRLAGLLNEAFGG